jgi:DNA-binding protein WhiA
MKEQKPTFSQKVKAEIIKNEKTSDSCCLKSYLAAIIRGAGSLTLGNEGLGIEISTTNIDLVKFSAHCIKKIKGVDCDIYAEGAKAKKNYHLRYNDINLLKELSIIGEDADGSLSILSSLDNITKGKDCCKKCFVKGMFLACGSITIPKTDSNTQSAGYHMEFQLYDSITAKDFAALLNKVGFDFKVTERSESSTIYIKDKNAISDMIAFMGANSSRLEIENLMIMRDIRNNANRQSNCVNANIDRFLDAAQRQIEAITKLIESGKLNTLDEKLRQAADMRMEHNDMTMDELAALMGITKSGVSHRMRKLIELAEEMEDK